MHTPQELETKLWKSLQSDRTLMLGLHGVGEGHTRPMTANVEDGSRIVWFFTSTDNALVQAVQPGSRAIAAFASKNHDLFASLSGRLTVDTDRAVIERLWNPFIAAWYEGGKTDPKLALLRLDAEHAEIWLNENNLLAGVKMLLGIDPKKSYEDKVANIDLR